MILTEIVKTDGFVLHGFVLQYDFSAEVVNRFFTSKKKKIPMKSKVLLYCKKKQKA